MWRELKQKVKASTILYNIYREECDKADGNATRKLSTGLQKLVSILPHLPALTTLSFRVKTDKWSAIGDNFHIPHQHIYKMVKNLPTSVKNLEIDTNGYECVTTPKSRLPRICDAVSGHLNHLEHVRIRLKRYCSHLLVPSESLKSLVICMTAVESPQFWSRCSLLKTGSDRSDRMVAKIANARRELVAGALAMKTDCTSIEALRIIDEDSKERGKGLYTTYVRDLMNGRTLSLPGGQSSYTSDVTHDWLRFDIGGELVDAMGGRSSFESVLEGRTWLTTTKGSRFPAACKKSSGGSTQIWDTTRKWRTRKQVLKMPVRDNKFMIRLPRLWLLEEERGRTLVSPTEVDHVGDVEALEMER
jgi:hypothetical protein